MISLTYKSFCDFAKQGNVIPIYQEIPADLDTPVSAFLKIRSGDHDFLLESVEGGDKWGRYSFLGTKPRAIFWSKEGQVHLQMGKKKESFVSKNPLEHLKKIMSGYHPVSDENLPRFTGGFVGYMAYDMARSFEQIPETGVDDLHIPDCYFVMPSAVLVFDNLRQVIRIVVNIYLKDHSNLRKAYKDGCLKIHRLLQKLASPIPKQTITKKRSIVLKPNRSEKDFCSLVEKAKEYIRAGDIFQVQVSTRFEGKAKMDPFELYRSIRRINPSPYLFYLHFGKVALVGASPEVMVRLENKRIEVRPIAGTRRRGYDLDEDIAMEEELRKDPKELAEHIMLVDLGRNDIGRVAQIGSVKVDELEVVERYSHVMHLVSHVSGLLAEGMDSFDVIRATFPAGTLTGAPKIRAMEIIEELEGIRRGTYGGCVGYLDFHGNLDLAITIRTALFHKGKIYVQAAGGIVADSVPRLEYKECQNKAMALIKALEAGHST